MALAGRIIALPVPLPQQGRELLGEPAPALTAPYHAKAVPAGFVPGLLQVPQPRKCLEVTGNDRFPALNKGEQIGRPHLLSQPLPLKPEEDLQDLVAVAEGFHSVYSPVG